MKVGTIPMSDLFKKCDDIYRVTMIAAKRSRQIIQSHEIDIDAMEHGVEDTEEIKELEQNLVEFEKPMVQALEEFISDKLEWRNSDLDTKDESSNKESSD